MNAREARTPLARDIIKDELAGGDQRCGAPVIELRLKQGAVTPPLGWTLSRAVEGAINHQLKLEMAEGTQILQQMNCHLLLSGK
jgi:hypothetical protein